MGKHTASAMDDALEDHKDIPENERKPPSVPTQALYVLMVY